ncbi:hypothetical protein INT47_011458 [Mucor saturninus]|uniref:DNA mismatch repair proteins mutS family domain-containing protein n=1 Tax=Mucor saturninus TaxID=64648 RepID=A0A8H7QXH6_9FUNG|nr:hypothetical protein INT47_011458 [Mucor saturninus]
MDDVKESKDLEYTAMLITQVMPKLLILSDVNEDILLEKITQEHGTSIEIKKVLQKDFSFEKGRYMLLNWYIKHFQTLHEQNSFTLQDAAEESLSNQNIFLIDPEEGNKTQAYLQLEGLIHLDNSYLTVGCAGVLLKHLQRMEQEGLDISQNEDDLLVQPATIRTFSSEKCMYVNSDTIRSLCIFDFETHPNMHQKQGKESLSLFGLLNKTTSVLGMQLLSDWVSRPTQDKEILDYRHESIRFFLQPNMREFMKELSDNLKHVKNIYRLLSKVKESKTNSNDWQHILKFAYYTIRTFGLINQLHHHGSNNVSFIKKAMHFQPATEVMNEVGSDINSIIDFETSKQEGRIIVKENVNNELDVLRKKYNALDDYLLQVSQSISSTLPIGLGSALNVVYFPQLGYLVTLPQYHNQNISDENNSTSSYVSEYYARYLTGFDLQFTTSENLYYKNEKTKELDETIGDIHALIADKEIEIIQDLSERVLKCTKQFFEVADILSELDCLISFALVALRFNYVQPVMTIDNSLMITQGRHPLQELCVEIFIPNDTYLQGGKGFNNRSSDDCLSTLYRNDIISNKKAVNSDDNQTADTTEENTEATKNPLSVTSREQGSKLTSEPLYKIEEEHPNSVQVVTGANFSGKSVYLKQIALIVYMAHIGSYVPAEKAIIGITDKLFTRIQTLETVSKPQSAFAFDLQQLHRALNNSTNRSLVIIDEFGKGTDCSDGAALFCSVIGYLLSKCSRCPKIVASTHFHDLIIQDILSAQDGITLTQTEIMSRHNKQGGEEGDEVVFLYRIVPGKGPNTSYGIWCAGIAGLPSSTIERAVELSENYIQGAPIKKVYSLQDEENYKMLELIRNEFLERDINQVNPYDLISSIGSLFKKT